MPLPRIFEQVGSCMSKLKPFVKYGGNPVCGGNAHNIVHILQRYGAVGGTRRSVRKYMNAFVDINNMSSHLFLDKIVG